MNVDEGTVTKKQQMKHIKKIKKVTDKINKGKMLGYRDLDVVLRALACHYAVIVLDMKERDKKEDESNGS